MNATGTVKFGLASLPLGGVGEGNPPVVSGLGARRYAGPIEGQSPSYSSVMAAASALPQPLPKGGGQTLALPQPLPVGGALDKIADGTEGNENKEARKAAQQFVANGLILPLLKQMRSNPLDPKLFDGGPGQDAFYQRLDTIFADRIVKSSRFPLVDQIYNRIMQRSDANRSAHPAAVTTGVNLHG